MKKLFFILVFLFIGGIVFSACHSTSKNDQHEHIAAIDYYTCPMHHQIHEEKPGECPICHMKLVPVYKEGDVPSSSEQKPMGPSVSISAERQQLIGMNTTPVVRKSLVKEIRAPGRVVFDPELAVAVREYLEISRSAPSLKEAARTHLKIFGLTDGEINNLGKGGSHAPAAFYLPNKNQPLWVYATLFESEMNLVQPGFQATIRVPSVSETSLEGIVRGVDPIVDSGTRSVRARIELPASASALLRPDTFVDVVIGVNLGEMIVVPRSAVLDTGARKIVFVASSGNHFELREVKVLTETDNETGIVAGLKEGDQVVTRAAFLVDSESQLKSAVQSAPTCPDGQVWDVGMSMCMPK